MSRKFDYMIIYLCDGVYLPAEGADLDDFGRDGWELVSVCYNKMFFKREIVNKDNFGITENYK